MIVVLIGERRLLEKRREMKCLDDSRIIELFLAGDEAALRETEQKYGSELKSLSLRITGSKEDANECFNDTLLKAWETVSETKPKNLRAYLMKITRNLSLNCVKKRVAGKRNAVNIALSELEECIPDVKAYAKVVDDNSLTKDIENWLLGINEDKRAIFIRRYFRFETSRSIAKSLGMREGTVAATLLRLRSSLKEYLAERDYII